MSFMLCNCRSETMQCAHRNIYLALWYTSTEKRVLAFVESEPYPTTQLIFAFWHPCAYMLVTVTRRSQALFMVAWSASWSYGCLFCWLVSQLAN